MSSSSPLQVLLNLPEYPITGRKQQRSCIMGTVIVNGKEDVVHACAVNKVDVESLLAANTEEQS